MLSWYQWIIPNDDIKAFLRFKKKEPEWLLATHWQRRFGDGGFVLLKENWLQGGIKIIFKLLKFFLNQETSDTFHGKPKN